MANSAGHVSTKIGEDNVFRVNAGGACIERGARGDCDNNAARRRNASGEIACTTIDEQTNVVGKRNAIIHRDRRAVAKRVCVWQRRERTTNKTRVGNGGAWCNGKTLG